MIVTSVVVALTLLSVPVSRFSHAHEERSSEAGAGRSAEQQPPLTNADVVRLTGAGLSESIVLASIHSAREVNFDLSPGGLLKLKAGKVSDAVIAAMFDRSQGRPDRAPPRAESGSTNATSAKSRPSATAVIPSEVGVYLLSAGRAVDVYPEIVNWRTGGVLKRIATGGLMGGHVNGWLANPRSPLQVAASTEFVVVALEGTAVTEYQLLRLDDKKESREFRVISTGVAGSRSGSERNRVPFESERLAPRTFRIRLSNLTPGEYGLLPPGMAGANVTSIGKIYTFSVR